MLCAEATRSREPYTTGCCDTPAQSRELDTDKWEGRRVPREGATNRLLGLSNPFILPPPFPKPLRPIVRWSNCTKTYPSHLSLGELLRVADKLLPAPSGGWLTLGNRPIYSTWGILVSYASTGPLYPRALRRQPADLRAIAH